MASAFFLSTSHQQFLKWLWISQQPALLPHLTDAPPVPPYNGFFSYKGSHGADRLSCELRGCVCAGTWDMPSAAAEASTEATGCLHWNDLSGMPPDLCSVTGWGGLAVCSKTMLELCYQLSKVHSLGMLPSTQVQTWLSNEVKEMAVQCSSWEMGQLTPLNLCRGKALCLSEQTSCRFPNLGHPETEGVYNGSKNWQKKREYFLSPAHSYLQTLFCIRKQCWGSEKNPFLWRLYVWMD